ncbi:MAG: AMP-binding protein [Desulfotignum sp.]|nr:AMP-binding protein [Desulfotignum sp.]MCF8112985.1 AMP-binding protein [Desulfotignum sp.]MCF8124998.1 AMP-binding protein [Desulfotignum sp.]
MNNLHGLSFFDIYEKNARLQENGCAVHWNDQDITHGELFAQTAQLAAGLSFLTPKTRVAVLCKNLPVFFHLFGAAAALNLTLVLINRRLSDSEIRHIIEDTTPSIILCDSEMAKKASGITAAFSFVDQCIVVDGPKENLSPLYQDSNGFTPKPFEKNDPYIIIHTAAVQGKPRGAVLSQENVLLSNLQLIQYYALDQGSCHADILPLFHIMGINMALATLQAGGKNVVVEKFDPGQTLALVQEQKVTLLGSFPPILTTLSDALEKENYDLTSLKITAGLDAPDTVKKWETATGTTFWTMYGQTETSGLITFAPYFEKPGSAGRISPLAHVKIADDLDSFVPPGQTGEILVKGPLVFQGYWNAPDLNAHTFRQGWHHTGDLGMIDPDGFLFFKGRKPEKELIKPGGENVFPAEVEKAIMQHDAVREVCVFGVPDPRFGEGIKAVCSLHPGKNLTKEELIRFTGSLIAGYKKPRYVEFTPVLPRTADGTIDRAQIKQTFS